METQKRFNRLLAALPPEEYQRLQLERCTPKIKESFYDPDTPIDYVYFPLYGVGSLLAIMADGTLVEVGTVGNEGMIGIPVFLGTSMTSGKAIWQVPGEVMRMKADDLRAEMKRGGALVLVLQRYTQALFVMLSQHTACNRIHPIEQRCARWLLMTHDRVDSDEFPLTQEFLSQMLGVRRAGVNEVMRAIQSAGLVDYRRGIITVLDRPGLEATACECYAIVRDEYNRMFDGKS